MPQPQVHFPGKGREALRQKKKKKKKKIVLKIWYGLTVHIIRFYRQKSLIFRLKYGTA